MVVSLRVRSPPHQEPVMVSTITAGLELHSRLLVVLSREQCWHLLWRELSHGDRRTC